MPGLGRIRGVMKDSEVTIGAVRKSVEDFISERGWNPKQNPKNVAGSIVIEAAELLELFQWASLEEAEEKLEDPDFRKRVAAEMADVMFYLVDMANQCGLELGEAFFEKLAHLEKKYPADMGLDSERYHEIKRRYRDGSAK